MNKSLSYVSLWILLGAGLMAGCGGGDGGPAGTGGGGGGSNQGVFLDSPVEGLAYSVGSKGGLTDAKGTFPFDGSAAVAFSVGGITLGASAPRLRVTPIDLVSGATDPFDPTVTNIAAFLQTIDDDGDPSNGIVITDAVRNAAAGKTIDFTMDTATFASDAGVLGAVSALTSATQAGERALVDPSTAQAHLSGTLVASLSGTYVGTMSISGEGDNQPQVGTFTFDVNSTSLEGTANISGSTTSMNGTVDSYGNISGTSGTGASFYGVIELDMREKYLPGGAWVTWGQYYSGTPLSWSGVRGGESQ